MERFHAQGALGKSALHWEQSGLEYNNIGASNWKGGWDHWDHSFDPGPEHVTFMRRYSSFEA